MAARKKNGEAAAKKLTKAEPAKKSEPARKSAGKSDTTAAAAAPLIDTSLAANAAAAMVGGKISLPSGQGGAKKESAAFKQLKAGLNKPSAGALGGVFSNPAQQKKSHQPFGGGKQVGHNQTFGADATRTGVPRRTPG